MNINTLKTLFIYVIDKVIFKKGSDNLYNEVLNDRKWNEFTLSSSPFNMRMSFFLKLDI